jgi:hypothetical protein
VVLHFTDCHCVHPACVALEGVQWLSGTKLPNPDGSVVTSSYRDSDIVNLANCKRPCGPCVAFDEPLDPREGPFSGLADWYRQCGSQEAQAARRDINAWYMDFPDREGMLLSRLQGDSDIVIHQATDELYVHHLLSSSYQTRYEEDARSPDFRLYRSSEYIGGIEVLTLFPCAQQRGALPLRSVRRWRTGETHA